MLKIENACLLEREYEKDKKERQTERKRQKVFFCVKNGKRNNT